MSAVQFLDNSKDLCSRCKEKVAEILTRKENFCGSCFIRFVRSKQRKSMSDEKFKVRYNKANDNLPKVLITTSFGKSSLVVTDAILSMLQEQADMHKGRQGFKVVILNIVQDKMDKNLQQVIQLVNKFYESINFEIKSLNPSKYLVNLKKVQVHDFMTWTGESISGEVTLEEALEKCADKSSKEDLITLMYEDLILQQAKAEKCDTIVYGHNMTRLANEIIALTVKGRGSSIHEKISDHQVILDKTQINIIYPMRDVLQAEIEAYVKVRNLEPLLMTSTIPVSKINRNMTIRELTTQYFNMLDDTGYASTASTVVKTGDKLGLPKDFNNNNEPYTDLKTCKICQGTIYQNPNQWLKKITVNEPSPLNSSEEKAYREEFLDQDPVSNQQENWASIDTCYGCIVTLGHVKNKDFAWRVQDTLDEYILTDDES